MNFIDPKFISYIESHIQKEPEILQELTRETHLKTTYPQMLAGHLLGRILAMFSKIIQPCQILEIGTFTGYSAICLCEGLQKGGMLHTIELNEEHEDLIKHYFKKAGISNKVKLYIGDALKIIPQIDKIFDLVFIDGNKKQYSMYFDLVFPKVRRGGIILADNVLWSGKVIENIDKLDKDTLSIINFNKKISQNPDVENVIIPVRDGLMVIRKK